MKVLDKGFIEVIDKLGSDLAVVNAARVSFGKMKEVFDEDKDFRLMKYLVRNKHLSPFRHILVQLHIKAPEFVMRQFMRHIVGIEMTSSYPTKDHGWSEISGRYKPVKEYYFPELWRKQSEDNKQASKGLVDEKTQVACRVLYENTLRNIIEAYEKFLEWGVAKEQARILLPLSQYTEVYWTASWQAIANFVELRNKDDSQWEIHEYAKIIDVLIKEIFPYTYKAWFEE